MQDANSNLSRVVSACKTSWKLRFALRLFALGLLYGYISGLHNQNPYYPVPESQLPEQTWIELEQCKEYIHRAWSWEPSPLWLPSYLLCKIPGGPGFGISSTKSGYLFRSSGHRLVYVCTSTILGGCIGLIAGRVGIAIRGKR
jgi:hypothetical protein